MVSTRPHRSDLFDSKAARLISLAVLGPYQSHFCLRPVTMVKKEIVHKKNEEK